MPVHVQAEEVPWVERTTGVGAPTTWSLTTAATCVRVGAMEVELIHTPGHTPGSQCFLVDGRLVAGDTLFLEGCGRTDLPGVRPGGHVRVPQHPVWPACPTTPCLFPGHLYSADPSQSMGDTRRTNYVFRPRSPGVDDHVRRMSRGGLPRDGTVVVVGASLAGLRAAETLRAEGFTGKITLVGDELHLPYDRPPSPSRSWREPGPPEKAVLADRTRGRGTAAARGARAPGRSAGPRETQVEIDDGTVLSGDALSWPREPVRASAGHRGLTHATGCSLCGRWTTRWPCARP